MAAHVSSHINCWRTSTHALASSCTVANAALPLVRSQRCERVPRRDYQRSPFEINKHNNRKIAMASPLASPCPLNSVPDWEEPYYATRSGFSHCPTAHCKDGWYSWYKRANTFMQYDTFKLSRFFKASCPSYSSSLFSLQSHNFTNPLPYSILASFSPTTCTPSTFFSLLLWPTQPRGISLSKQDKKISLYRINRSYFLLLRHSNHGRASSVDRHKHTSEAN